MIDRIGSIAGGVICQHQRINVRVVGLLRHTLAPRRMRRRIPAHNTLASVASAKQLRAEKKREYMRAYLTDYNKRPEVSERRRAWQRDYLTRPGVSERKQNHPGVVLPDQSSTGAGNQVGRPGVGDATCAHEGSEAQRAGRAQD